MDYYTTLSVSNDKVLNQVAQLIEIPMPTILEQYTILVNDVSNDSLFTFFAVCLYGKMYLSKLYQMNNSMKYSLYRSPRPLFRFTSNYPCIEMDYYLSNSSIYTVSVTGSKLFKSRLNVELGG